MHTSLHRTCTALPVLLSQLHTLTQLYLQDCGLSSFAGLLRHLPSLSVLALPFNHITSLAGLADGAASNALAELDVSHNQIGLWSESWLADCTALTALDASCNVSTQPGDLQPVVRYG
jgi:Leucine-rich repeat (LRR) protein